MRLKTTHFCALQRSCDDHDGHGGDDDDHDDDDDDDDDADGDDDDNDDAVPARQCSPGYSRELVANGKFFHFSKQDRLWDHERDRW